MDDIGIRYGDVAFNRRIGRRAVRAKIDSRPTEDRHVRHEYAEHAQIDRARDGQVELGRVVRAGPPNR